MTRAAATLLLIAAAGCAQPPPVLAEAEALAAQGKLEESADKLALVCAFAPARDDCAAIDRQVAERRLKAAEQAITEGRYAAGERALRLASLTDSAPVREAVTARLGKGDLAAGRRYEVALRLPDRRKTYAELVDIAKVPAPEVARLATQWIDRERPAMLIADVKDTCQRGGEARGSCSEAAAAMRALTTRGPAYDEADALARAEEVRVYPLRVAAERMLPIYAAYGKLDKQYDKCLAERPPSTDPTEADPKLACTREVFGEDGADKRQRHELAFQKALAEIGDPALMKALEKHSLQAITDAKYEKADIPRPEGVK